MPPADWFGVFDGDNGTDGAVVEEYLSEEGVVWAVAEDMANGEDFGGLLLLLLRQLASWRCEGTGGWIGG
jgi:hypothetical protein